MTTQTIKQVLLELREYWLANNVPNITDSNVEYLTNIIKTNNCKNILEIGSANWFSTICFGELMLENWGKVTSIEFSKKSYEQAIENIKKAWLENIINLILGQALDIIPTLENDFFDFVFIDGMKRRSPDFLDLSIPKATKNAIIVVDDVIKFRYKMENLYDYVEEKWLKYEVIKIDEDDGIMLIQLEK